MISEFSYTSFAQQILFGPGALDRLREEVERAGWQKIQLCTIPRLARSGLVDRVAGILGPRLVAIFSEAQPHVPQAQVEAAAALAADRGVEAIIGLGGGSPIGLAKAASQAAAEKRRREKSRARQSGGEVDIPIIAIPTTYAGSEMTPIYGITRLVDGTIRKMTVTDPRATPRLVLYDPELTLPLDPLMTASSGINALAHGIEAVYSISRNPVSTAAALAGIEAIRTALPRAVAHGDDLPARIGLMMGAHLAAVSVATAKIGLHHGLCHVLGGSAGIPHGIANGIMLPHAIRYNATTMVAELAAVARALGLEGDSEVDLAARCAGAVDDLIARIDLPRRLRDVGVDAAELSRLARLAMHSAAVQNNPRPVTDAAEIEQIYQAAW